MTLLIALAERFAVNAEAHAWRVSARIHQEIDDFALGAEVTAQTRAAVTSNLLTFVSVVRRQNSSKPPDTLRAPPEAVRYAHAFVHRRIPLRTLLRTYLLGHSELWRAWAEEVRAAELDPEAELAVVRLSSELMFSFMDDLTTDVVRAYEEERERWVRSMAAIRDELVTSLLDGRHRELDDAERVLAYGLRESHLGLILWAPEGANADRALDEVWRDLVRAITPAATLVMPLGRRVIRAWVGGTRERVAVAAAAIDAWLPPSDDVGIGVGQPARGVDGFRRTHEQAAEVRRVSELGRLQLGRVTWFNEVAVPALATAHPHMTDHFVAEQLKLLATDDEAMLKLRQTLECYFEQGESQSSTARQLDVHFNTVTNRLRRIEELIGAPITSKRLELQLALRLVRYVPGSSG